MTYFECWKAVATTLLAQALAGEPALSEAEAGSGADPDAGGSGEGAFGFEAMLGGDLEGRFVVALDGALLEAALMGEGADQRAGWQELMREVAEAAAGELLARGGRTCQVAEFRLLDGAEASTGAEAGAAGAGMSAHGFRLTSGERTWSLRVEDATRETVKQAADVRTDSAATSAAGSSSSATPAASPDGNPAVSPNVTPGVGLLLDVELEAALRFGCREMPLGEILDLGPGDVVELDRHIADPVDLIVGDKIVARGEVVLVNGNFGLRVTEVAEPRRRLESIRCLF
ncbi:MAG TPA: FliM/FliN family flagellar motor switch protein [Terracidiphilus sp.]|nr:FliM/FliN family flagellar motor switch protein [Terracidiphilus sp.]